MTALIKAKPKMFIELNKLINKLPVFTNKSKKLERKVAAILLTGFFLVSLLGIFSYSRYIQRLEALQNCGSELTSGPITSTVTITADAVDGVRDCSNVDITIAAGGELILASNITDNSSTDGDYGVTLLVRNLTIDAGGKISADGQGYLPGDGESTGNGGSAIPGNVTGGSGGGHGGAGGESIPQADDTPPVPGVPFGDKNAPITLGGSGGNSGEGGLGGNGGGAIKIISSATFTLNGSITANGLNGTILNGDDQGSGGGGAGGSIWIEALNFAGSGGSVKANGGNAADSSFQGGGGGGGYIVMFCSVSNNLSGNETIQANGGVTTQNQGQGSQDGQNGNIYGPTCKPQTPSILNQYRTDQISILTTGEATTEDKVVFVGNLSDPDSGEQLVLEVEIKEIGTAFSNAPTLASAGFTNPQSCSSPPANCGMITAANYSAGLMRSKEYHWQARVRDEKGGVSGWFSFGANPESQRDFLVTGLPVSLQITAGNNQTEIVGTQLADTLEAKVEDAAGFGVPGQIVDWRVTNAANGGTLLLGTTVTHDFNTWYRTITDNQGIARNNYQLGQQSGTNNNTIIAEAKLNNTHLSGSPITYTASATPGTIHHFSVQGPSVALINQDFDPVTITAYDQYNNIKINYTGTVNFSAVDPNDLNTTLQGNLQPVSYTFTADNQGVRVFSTANVNPFSYDTEQNIKIKVEDNLAVGYSNTIAVVTSLGNCPAPVVSTNQTWTADLSNNGIFNCPTLLVTDGATLTLASYTSSGTPFGVTIISSSLTIDANSKISADGQGYPLNTGPVLSYGGYGTSGTPYGSVYEPISIAGSPVKGRSGGAIKLVADTMTINGSVTANGADPAANSCGSPSSGGGSIWLDANTLNGSATAKITTNAFYESNCANAHSSGGRIAVYYSSGNLFSSFGGSEVTDFIQSRGAGDANGGSGAGTIYIEDRSVSPQFKGKIYVDNNNINFLSAAIIQGDYQFDKIRLTRKGNLTMVGQPSTLTIAASNDLAGDTSMAKLKVEGTFIGPTALNINGLDLHIRGEINLGTATADSNVTIGTSQLAGLTLYANTWAHNKINQYAFDQITVTSQGTLALEGYDNGDDCDNDSPAGCTNDYGVTVNLTNLDVQAGGLVTAVGKGYNLDHGPGATDRKGANIEYASSYGGYGVKWNSTTSLMERQGEPYGNVYTPDQLGSSGRNTKAGGAIKLIVSDTLTINGTIDASSAVPPSVSCGAAGGTGGSIWLDVNNLNGSSSGIIKSNAYDNSICSGALSSGGRIAIYYQNENYLSSLTNLVNNIQTRGADQANPITASGSGTIYLKQRTFGDTDNLGGKIYVDNNNIATGLEAVLTDSSHGGQSSYQFSEINLTRNGHLLVKGQGTGCTNTLYRTRLACQTAGASWDPGTELIVTASSSLKGDSTYPDLKTEGTFVYTNANKTLNINGVDVSILGEIEGVDNINIANNSIGGFSLFAHTWAHDDTFQYTFADISIGSTGTFTMEGYDSGNDCDNDSNGCDDDYGVSVTAQNVTVETGGLITAVGKGYLREHGPGATDRKGANLQYGASHGGYAVIWNSALSQMVRQGNPYGSAYTPDDLGSSARHARGGGAIKLIVSNTLTLNGQIDGSGEAPASVSCGAAGGSGGSIWINAKTFNGSSAGTIKSNAYDFDNCAGSHSSGGRIAIYYEDGNYLANQAILTNSIQARGSSQSSPITASGGGTIYIKQKSFADNNLIGGNIYADNNNINTQLEAALTSAAYGGESSYEFNEINLTRNGHLIVLGEGTACSDTQYHNRVECQNNSQIWDPGTELIVQNSNSLKGDSTFPDLKTEGTFIYTNNNAILNINNIDVTIKGEIEGVQDINIGNTSQGGFTIFAHTWAHNQDYQYTFGDILVGATGTMTFEGYDSGDNCTSSNIALCNDDYGATITADNINIQNGGLITAVGKGYNLFHGQGTEVSSYASSYGGYGVVWDAANSLMQRQGNPYGSAYTPDKLGSSSNHVRGGGSIKLIVNDTLTINGQIDASSDIPTSISCGAPSGSGGSIWLNVKNLNGTNTGLIRTNTATYTPPSGVCSGALSSAGRVAIYYQTETYLTALSDLTNNIQARGVSQTNPITASGGGTVYIKQRTFGDTDNTGGAIYVNNNNIDTELEAVLTSSANGGENSYQFSQINLNKNGHLLVKGEGSGCSNANYKSRQLCEDNGASWNPGTELIVTNTSSLVGDNTFPDLKAEGTFIYANPNQHLQVNGLDVDILGEIEGVTDLTIGNTSYGGFTLHAHTWAHNNVYQYQFGDIVIGANGTMTLKGYDSQSAACNYQDQSGCNGYGVRINADLIDLTSATSLITADGEGYERDRGPGTKDRQNQNISYGSSYGGYDAQTNANPYGDLYNPVDLGSSVRYGKGGGGINLIATTINIEGKITANGGDILSTSCGSAGTGGGSIQINAGTLNGNTLGQAYIQTNASLGGVSGNCAGEQSSGGRIAVNYADGNFISNIGNILNRLQARGISQTSPIASSGPGTVYVDDTDDGFFGSLYIGNGTVDGRGMDFLPQVYSFHNLVIDDHATVKILSNINTNSGVVFDLTGDFTLGSTAMMDGIGLGFGSGAGPGAGQNGEGNSSGGGAAHGGNGGNGQSDGANPLPLGGIKYGDQLQPTTLGSGGGLSGLATSGGKGGSAVQFLLRNAITGDGHAQIDGIIDMSGTDGKVASPGGGGGAGGSISFIAGSCDITGSLIANGGDGGDDTLTDGGGGGGGRISLLYTTSACNVNGSVLRTGGSGNSASTGQQGTYPDPDSLPSLPLNKNQYKTDAATLIEVGGYTPETEVVLKAEVDDIAASQANPKDLVAQFEVVTSVDIFDEDPANIYQSNTVNDFTGGSPVEVNANIPGLINGESYKWRFRSVNINNGLTSEWAEFGQNPSSSADFIVSNTEDLQLDVKDNEVSVYVGEPISLIVSALDTLNNIDPNYNGTVHFTSTANQVILPSNYIFGPSDSGVHEFTDQLIFLQPGVFTVTVTDTLDSSLSDVSPDITVIVLTPTSTPTIAPSNTPTITPSRTVTPSVTQLPSITPTGTLLPTNTPTITSTSAPLPTNTVVASHTPVPTTSIIPLVGPNIYNVRETLNNKQTKIIICWDTNIETVGYIDWGLAKQGVYTNTTDVEIDYIIVDHCMTLSGLTNDTAYIYRITATAKNGLSDDYQDTFATNKAVVPTVVPEECVIQQPYAFNSEGQIIINYSTTKISSCSLNYGNDNSLPYSSTSESLVEKHQGIIELDNLNGIDDIIYKISCQVGKPNKQISCSRSGVIPQFKFEPYTPPPVEQVKKPAVISSWVGLVPVLFTSVLTVFSYPGWILYAIGWLKDRKTQKGWGVIFDTELKTPVVFASVKVFSQNAFLKEQITDVDGRYGFVLDQGEYRLEVHHPDYKTIAKVIKLDLKEGLIGTDIGLQKPQNADGKIKLISSWREIVKQNLLALNSLLVIFGFILSIVITILSPSWFNFAVIGFYILQFILIFLLQIRKRNWGFIFDDQSQQRIMGAFVRLFDPEAKRQLEVKLTDQKGRYNFNLKPGSYEIIANAQGYLFPSAKQIGLIDKAGVKIIAVKVNKSQQINLPIGLVRQSTNNATTSGIPSPF